MHDRGLPSTGIVLRGAPILRGLVGFRVLRSGHLLSGGLDG